MYSPVDFLFTKGISKSRGLDVPVSKINVLVIIWDSIYRDDGVICQNQKTDMLSVRDNNNQ